MSSELKYKIADKVVFQKVKTALGKNKSFIGLILKLLDCNKKLAGIKVRNTILVLKYTFLVQNRLKLKCECKRKITSSNQLYMRLGEAAQEESFLVKVDVISTRGKWDVVNGVSQEIRNRGVVFNYTKSK